MGDNIWLPDRNGVRTPMQWTEESNAGFSDAPVHSLYSSIIDDENFGPMKVNVKTQRKSTFSIWNTIRRMIAIRKKHHAFGWGEFEWVDCKNDAIAAYRRTYNGETILVIQNLSEKSQEFSCRSKGLSKICTDLLTQKEYATEKGKLQLKLKPYKYLWLK